MVDYRVPVGIFLAALIGACGGSGDGTHSGQPAPGVSTIGAGGGAPAEAPRGDVSPASGGTLARSKAYKLVFTVGQPAIQRGSSAPEGTSEP